VRKIDVEKQIYLHRKGYRMKWKDIKHLELEDEDVIRSEWVEDENFECHGYWHGSVTRVVEETDEQYEKRVRKHEIFMGESKKRRYENYLKLKKEFEDGK
jgi:hypothetical protein